MENIFQSKSVPRGTRTIWRYLSALILFFSLSIGQMWGGGTITLKDITPSSNWYEVSGVGRVSNKNGAAFAASDNPCSGVTSYKTGSSYFSVQTYTKISSMTVHMVSGSNRNLSGVAIGNSAASSAPSSVDANVSSPASGDKIVAKNTCDNTFTIEFSTAVDANQYISVGLSGNAEVAAVTLVDASSVPVSSVTIVDPANNSHITVGDVITIETTVLPENATNKALEWTVESESNATITDAGVLTAIAAGDINVIATAKDGSGKSAEIHLFIDAVDEVCPSGLSIAGTAAYTEGQTISLTAGLAAGNGDITYTWYKGADFATAKAAGSIGTGASFSQASCETGDAGYYWCEATKTSCEPAHNGTEFVVSVEAKTCPTSGEVFSWLPKTGLSDADITAGTHDLPGSWLTSVSGGSAQMYVPSNGNMRIRGSQLAYNSSNAYIHVVLDCALEAGDVIDVNSSGNKNNIWLSLTSSRPSSASNAAAVIAQGTSFVLSTTNGETLIGEKEFYVWRNSNTTQVGQFTITRPYNVSFVSAHGTAPTTPGKAVSLTLEEITGVEGWTHTGWTADKVVKVGNEDKAAGTALAVNAEVELTDNTTFTATWEAIVTKYTVTYYDGATELGTELVEHGNHPVGLSIAPHKLGYTFAGWSLTDGGAIVAFPEVTVNADMPLYTVWNEVDCSVLSGTIFSLAMDVAPAANCTIKTASGYDGSVDLVKYATISGGIAMAENSSTNNHLIITTDPLIRFTGGSGYVHISFDCALKVGDKIKTTISNQNIAYTTTSTRSTTNSFTKGTDQELTITSGHALENANEIYLWAASSSDGRLSSLQVIRPEKYAVTFNMHGHGDAPAAQSITDGGKVTKPSDPTASGWDFGGWFTDDTYGTYWDFDNMTISAATEIHALWTEHVASSDATLSSLTVNGEAITLEDGVFGYAFELPMGTTALPTIEAVPNDSHSKGVSVVQTNIGSATITVTAEDDSFKAYTITFMVATSKDIELVWDKSVVRCDATTPSAVVKSDNASVSAYINKITATAGGEGSSLNVGKNPGDMFTLSAKPGYAFKAMSFFGKIEDASCEYSLDGGAWQTLTSTNTGGNACYADVFSAAEVHELRMKITGSNGFWIRNMQLTLIEACTPVAITWDEEPVEFEVGKAGYAIAATANNSGTITYGSTDASIVAVDAGNGVLSVAALGPATLSASTAEGDGTTYCANGGNDIVISKVVNTYYLVKFDGQNGEAADEVKYFSGDAAIALPAAPSYSGYDFQGWFDAETGGNQYTVAITPTASTTVYAQWVAQCDGATITTQPTGASYLTGRTPVALVCEATAGAGGELTYEWFTCDDALKTNPVAATATPSTAVAGTFYYFCKVTEEGCAVEAFSDVVTITVTDKDPICLIATTVTGATAHGAVTGFLGEDRGGDAEVNVTGGSYKMDRGKYIGVALPDGYKFQEGDKVVLNVMTVNNATGFTLFDGKDGEKNLIIDTRDGNLVPAGANTVVLPAYAGSQSVYVLRENNDQTGNLNSAINAIAVYRTCAPILNKVTVNGVEGKPNALNQVVFEVAASTTQSQLEAIAFDWVSNDDAWTAANAPVAANAWEFGVANEVTFTDKDGDASVYYVTISKAAASSDATLSALTVNGQAIALADGVFNYSFELPYGTSVVPTVVATANHVAATATVDPCTLSGATITVVPESGAGDQQVYTLTFVISKWKEVAIWDGSYMTEVATSPDATTGLVWTVNGFNGVKSNSTTLGEKTYPKYLETGGSASATRNVELVVPEGYVAKFYIVFGSHTSDARSIFIGSTATKTLDASSVLHLTSNSRDELVNGTSEIVGAGTWYINPMASIDIQEIRAYLRPGYARTAMLGNGVLGTVCVDHNVAVEDIQGVTVYELVGREPQYGKVAFDEIVSGELEAGAPYVFQAHGDRMVLFFGDTKVDDPVDKGNGMYGTFVDQTLTELNDIYYFAQRALWSCVDLSSLSVPANRAYVKLSEIDYISDPNPAPGRRRVMMSVNSKNTPTGLEMTNDQSQMTNKVLIDGQLFILRGEKMYDATGRLVK